MLSKDFPMTKLAREILVFKKITVKTGSRNVNIPRLNGKFRNYNQIMEWYLKI